MVQAIINIGDNENRVLTILKGRFGLRNKSDVINFLIDDFERNRLEPELRPEYKTELAAIDKGKFKKFSSIDELRREIENV